MKKEVRSLKIGYLNSQDLLQSQSGWNDKAVYLKVSPVGPFVTNRINRSVTVLPVLALGCSMTKTMSATSTSFLHNPQKYWKIDINFDGTLNKIMFVEHWLSKGSFLKKKHNRSYDSFCCKIPLGYCPSV